VVFHVEHFALPERPLSDLLAIHRGLLERWRKVMNLVGPGPLEGHYLDCQAALVGLEPSGRWADLGSGAGFPGIVFAAMYPGVQVDLVDSRRKRCVFLEEVAARAGESGRIHVVNRRIEDLAPGYDGLLARALAPPPVVLGLATQLLLPGGLLLLMHGVDAILPAPDGLEAVHTRHYDVDDRPRAATLFRSHGAPRRIHGADHDA